MYFPGNVNLRGIAVIIGKSIMFRKKRWNVLKYLLNLENFFTVTILTH